MNVRNGQLLGLGSSPTYDPSVFAKPRVPPSVYKALTERATRRAAASTARPTASIRPARPSSRSPRWRRSTPARSASTRSSTTPASSRSATGRCSTTPATPSTGRSTLEQALKVSSDVFFYTLGYRMDRGTTRRRRAAAAVGAGARDRPADRARRRRRGRRAAADARSGATSFKRNTAPEPAVRRGGRASPRARSPTGRGRSATTSTSRSARATCRPTRCRWRSRTRRSPTAATSSRRTSACASRTRTAARSRRSTRRPRPRRHRPGLAPDDPRRPPRGRDGARRDLLLGLRRLPGRDRRQDRNRRAARPGRPVLVHRARAVPRPEVRRRGHDRAGRVRRRLRGPGGTGDPQPAAARRRKADGGHGGAYE